MYVQLFIEYILVFVFFCWLNNLKIMVKHQPHEGELTGESPTSYELGWFSVNSGNVFLSIRDRWKVPPKSSAPTALANNNEEHFLAGYLNCSCLQNKRVLLDTFIVHLGREQPFVSQGRVCVAPWTRLQEIVTMRSSRLSLSCGWCFSLRFSIVPSFAFLELKQCYIVTLPSFASTRI